MKIIKPSFSIRLINSLAHGAFWFLAFGFVIILVFALLTSFGVISGELGVDFRFPTTFSMQEKGVYNDDNIISDFSILKTSGVVEIENPPTVLRIFLPLITIPILGAVLYMLWLFKKFTSNVKLGNTFHKTNIRNLKHIAYLVVGYWVYEQVITILLNCFVVKNLSLNGITFENLPVGGLATLVFALIIWVLSHIFEKGAAIETDNQLTI